METLGITLDWRRSGKRALEMKLVTKPTAARRQRRQLSAEFTAKVALAALREDKTMAELCAQFAVHSNPISEWKKQLIAPATEVFGGSVESEPIELDPLHAKIGQLALENDSLREARSSRRAGLVAL